MNALFCGQYAPITSTIGFIKYECPSISQAFIDWQKEIQSKRGVSLTKTEVHGNLETIIQKLFPLTSVEKRRYLFLPTRSPWTAFLDNGHQGTDVFAPLSYLAKILSVEAVRATCTKGVPGKRYPAVMLEMYGPSRSVFLNYVRSIGVGYDGKKWTFVSSGEVQPFESVDQYSNRSIKDRFTPEMLEGYLKALQIDAFDENFYCPDNQPAVLIEKSGPIAPAAREFQLGDL